MLTESQYHELVEKYKDERILLEVDFLQLGILSVFLDQLMIMLKHPEVEAFSTSYHQCVEDLQRHILSKYAEIDLSREDINAIAEEWT